jgi:hypothetical protein
VFLQKCALTVLKLSVLTGFMSQTLSDSCSLILIFFIKTHMEKCFTNSSRGWLVKQYTKLTHIILVKHHAANYTSNWQPTELKQGSLVPHYSANVGTVHCCGDGQLFMCFFQYLYTSDIWVACYMLHFV